MKDRVFLIEMSERYRAILAFAIAIILIVACFVGNMIAIAVSDSMSIPDCPDAPVDTLTDEQIFLSIPYVDSIVKYDELVRRYRILGLRDADSIGVLNKHLDWLWQLRTLADVEWDYTSDPEIVIDLKVTSGPYESGTLTMANSCSGMVSIAAVELFLLSRSDCWDYWVMFRDSLKQARGL